LALDDIMGGGARRGGPPRRAGTRALTFWAVALIAGGSAALLLRWYIERSAQPVAAPMTKIIVAAVDLPLATTLRPEHLRLADWPASVQPTGVLRDTKEVVGRVVIAKIVQGEPILAVKLASKDAGRGLAALIPEGMRGEAVRVDEVVGVAGFIHPDDRVDVIATIGVRGPGSVGGDSISKVILQNVKVLAVGRDLDVADHNRTKAMSVTVVTLLVTPAESEKLALTANTARLTLTLRSWTDDNPVETPGANALSLMTGAEAIRRPPPVAAAPVVETTSKRSRKGRAEGSVPTGSSVAATPQKEVVEILRGDRLEERKFDKEKP
jgi:pilus assembly protein CpaB